MTDACRCGGHDTTAVEPRGERLAATTTVAEISRRPQALQVLKRLGINHCCGAHLTLAEAAAAAGVPLGELLSAIAKAESAS